MAYLLFFATFVASIIRWAALASVAAVMLVAAQVMIIVMVNAMSTNPVFLREEDAAGEDASTGWIMEEEGWEEVSGVLAQV